LWEWFFLAKESLFFFLANGIITKERACIKKQELILSKRESILWKESLPYRTGIITKKRIDIKRTGIVTMESVYLLANGDRLWSLGLTYHPTEKSNVINDCLENQFTPQDVCDDNHEWRVKVKFKLCRRCRRGPVTYKTYKYIKIEWPSIKHSLDLQWLKPTHSVSLRQASAFCAQPVTFQGTHLSANSMWLSVCRTCRLYYNIMQTTAAVIQTHDNANTRYTGRGEATHTKL